MSSTNFVNGSTLSDAGWANDVDTLVYSGLSSVSGTNTIVGTGPVSMTAYAAKQIFTFIPANTNTGATTLNITPSGASALGAKNIYWNGGACIGGEIRASVPAIVQYDGTQFNLLSQGGAINNTPIGQTNPLAGTFTTATANSFIPNSATVPTNGMYLPAANTLGWSINSAEAMRLASSGDLIIPYNKALYWNTTSDQYVFADSTTVYVGVAGFARLSVSTGSTGVRFYDYGAGTLTTNASGVISATSDLTQKTITGQFTRGREALRGWNPILYEWTAESGLHDGMTYAGYGAQHILPHIPEAVFGIEGNYTVMDRPILMVAVNAIKELGDTTDDHESRLAALEAENTALKARLTVLESKQ